MDSSVQQPVNTPSEKETTTAVQRVAVIAVHGVGYTEPGATVRHLADLLLGLGRFRLNQKTPWGPDIPPYSGFRTQPIQVPLKAAPVSDRQIARQRTVNVLASKPGFWLNLWHYLDEHRGYIAGVFASKKKPPKLDTDLEDRALLGHEFMRAQLAGYVSEPEGKSYDTIRLETERSDVLAPQRTVHLYESYWADLARPQNSILSFFLAFYQLLLHLGSLSRTAVDYATLEHYENRYWRWHAFCQASAVRFLVLPITILNLYLLLAGLSGLPSMVGWNHCLLAAFVLGIIALASVLQWPRFRDAPRLPLNWIGLLAGAFFLGWLIGYFFAKCILSPDVLLGIEWWLLGGGVLYLVVLKPYEQFRRGAVGVGVVLYIPSFLGYLYCLYQAPPYPNMLDQASFWSMQIIMCGLILSWLGLLASALSAWVLHFVCLSVLPKGVAAKAERVRARAALRTGRLTLAASASLFLVLTIFLWDGLYSYTRKQLHLHAHVQLTQVPMNPSLGRLFRLIVPTLDDAIRWTHRAPSQPEKCPACKVPAPVLSREARLAKLERLDWSRLPDCTPTVPPCVAPSTNTLEVPLVAPVSENDLVRRLGRLEDKAGIRAREQDFDTRLIAPLDTESRLYRLELLTKPNSEEALDTYANGLLLVSATAGLHLLLIGFALALALLAWAVVPCLLGDTYSLADPKVFNNRLSRQLGNWFSRGLDSTRSITFLLWHAIFSLVFVFGGLDFAYSHGWMDPHFFLYAHCPSLLPLANLLARFLRAATDDALHVLTFVGAYLAVSGAVVAAALLKKGRVVLDIILDVDHYLRTSPLERAPRACIAERYTSLLRFIATQKDQDGKPYYTSLIIAAHSLGALISADLLQYLKRECAVEPDPELASLGFTKPPENKDSTNGEAAHTAMPIQMFTFGNPLRQLLNRFFPHLYWWIREEPDNALDPLPNAVETLPNIENGATPDPAKHNLARWINAYRSGDFIGRSLWLDGWFARNSDGPEKGNYPDPPAVAVSPNTSRVEFCIGLGGHNNYWDRSAPDMAHALDEIICS